MSIRRRIPALASSSEMPLPRMCQPTRCARAAPTPLIAGLRTACTITIAGLALPRELIAEPTLMSRRRTSRQASCMHAMRRG